jgi:DNA gyrase/topoisomerase IV subunit B
MSPDAPEPSEYTAADIQVVAFEESVRNRPAMYFRCARTNPALPAEVVRTVVGDAPTERADGPARVRVVVETDHRFTVTDNAIPTNLDPDGRPSPGFYGSLLPRRRWPLAAAAALSSRTWIEIRTSSQSWSQELHGTTPVGPPQTGGPADTPGTRVTFELDATYFAPGATLPKDMVTLLNTVDGNHPSASDAVIDIADLR